MAALISRSGVEARDKLPRIKNPKRGRSGVSASSQSFVLGELLRPHVRLADARNRDRFLHRVAAERLAEFLVENAFDEGRLVVFHLTFDSGSERIGKLFGAANLNAFEATTFGDLRVFNAEVQFGADEVVVEPKGRIALFRTPLVLSLIHI